MVMKAQRKREGMSVRVCAREEVSGQGEGRGYIGRNSLFPVTVLRIAVHTECRGVCLLLIKHWITSQHFIMKNFEHTVMLNKF